MKRIVVIGRIQQKILKVINHQLIVNGQTKNQTCHQIHIIAMTYQRIEIQVI